MKHQNKRERKAAKRIETTGVIGEFNITERETLILSKILTFFTLRVNREFKNERSFMGFNNEVDEMKTGEVMELTQKVRRLADYVMSIHGKTPEEIAAISVAKQAENEKRTKLAALVDKAATPEKPFGPQPLGATAKEIVEAAL